MILKYLVLMPYLFGIGKASVLPLKGNTDTLLKLRLDK